MSVERELGRQDAVRLAIEQGLPAEVEDLSTLRRLAAILDNPEAPPIARIAPKHARTARATRPRGTSKVAS